MYSASSLEPKRLDPVTESFILVSPFILWVAAFTGISNICCNRWNFGSHPGGVCVSSGSFLVANSSKAMYCWQNLKPLLAIPLQSPSSKAAYIFPT